ncbi:histidine phosphatase family protein [Chloroflexota bacterium]
MTEIILARHGETEWNTDEIFRGRVDIELNETGINQAKLLAEYLRDKEVEAIYSSPLKRAIRTAAEIASHHKPEVKITPGLIDFHYGEWQGLSHQEVKDKYKEIYKEWIYNPPQATIPEGEQLNDVRQRAIGVVDEITVKHSGTVILVSHRVVNKILICALLGLDNSHFWNIRQDTCGITTFTYENKRFTLTEHNNTSYLKPLQQSELSDF